MQLLNMILIIFSLVLAAFQARPAIKKFTDQCVDQAITNYKQYLSPKLYEIFQNSFPNTLDTTIQHHQPTEPVTFIITGDIPAMWLRDSTNQILPYMKLSETCTKTKTLVQGLINTQAKLIMVDPYTNAFVDFSSPRRQFYLNDQTYKHIFGISIDLVQNTKFSTKKIWQRKYQIDSLASFLRLIYQYNHRYQTFDFLNINVLKAIKRILTLIQEQSMDDSLERRTEISYTFSRTGAPNQLLGGKISASSRIGLVKSGFRPSDDPTKLPYNIPGNAMLATFLKKVGNMLLNIPSPFYSKIATDTAHQMLSLSRQINQSIYRYGIISFQGLKVFAYEIDGKDHWLFYDDGNLPSLVSLSYMEFVNQDDEIYQNTRKLLFTSVNPYYFELAATKLKGIGSSHTPIGYIWPLAIMTQALTTKNEQQIKQCLYILQETSVNNFLHQSVNINNPKVITREWFAWANSFFGQLMIELVRKYPHLVK